MLKLVILREFYANIITFRFLLGFITCVGLIGANTVVLVRDYERTLQTFQAREQDYIDKIRNIRAYSELSQWRQPMAYKKPKLLSLLNEGVEGQVGDAVTVAHNHVPVFTEAEESHDNPYLVIFPRIDLTLVFQIIISLLAFLFAYDAIAGEKEEGTLALVLSNPVPRGVLLLGKYLGGMLSLTVPLAVSLLIASLIILGSPSAHLSGSDWGRIGIFCLVSLLYISVFFTLGLLFSSTTRRAATALMIAMFFWVIFVVVWPHASEFGVSQFIPLKSNGHLTYDGANAAWARGADHLIMDLASQWRAEIKKFGEQRDFPMSWGRPSYFDGPHSDSFLTGTYIGKYTGPSERHSTFHEIWNFREEASIRKADELGERQYRYLLENPIPQARVAQRVARISPAGAYSHATAVLVGTDLDSHLRFLNQAKQYRLELIQYLRDQNAFGSEKWYNPEALKEAHKKGIPLFREEPESLSSSIKRATGDVLILGLLNLAFCLLTCIAFIRYEAR